MANRVMQAKRAKMVRMKRTFPKHMQASYIPVGAPPNRLVMSECKERTRSLAFDHEYLNWLETVTRFKNKPPGKVEAEATWRRLRDACPTLMNVTLEVNLNRCVKMFYNQERNNFIIYEENYTGRFVRASIHYQDRKRCIDRFKSNTVRWVEFVSSSPPEP